MRCFDCTLRSVSMCDKHGIIPAHMVEKPIKCPDFVGMEDAEAVLMEWSKDIDKGSREDIYITALLDAMSLRRISPEIDPAICWLYTLPDNPKVRSVRHAVVIYDDRAIF